MYLKGADLNDLPNSDVLGVLRRMLGVLTLLRERVRGLPLQG